MKKDNKKTLYESIMTSVAREVKKALNESFNDKHIDYDYIESAAILTPLRISYLIEYAKNQLKNGIGDEVFLRDWIYKMERAKRNNRIYKYTSTDPGHNSNVEELYDLISNNSEFVYDLIQYGLSQPDITIPRKQKLNKMLLELF